MRCKRGGDIHVRNGDVERPVRQTLAAVGSLCTAPVSIVKRAEPGMPISNLSSIR